MSESPHISVISPVYDAAGLLEELVRRIKAAVSLITEDYEIILVEDCGPDNSWELIGKLCAESVYAFLINTSVLLGSLVGLWRIDCVLGVCPCGRL